MEQRYSGKETTILTGKKYKQLRCWVARRAFLVFSTFEDIQKDRIKYANLHRAYLGDEQEIHGCNALLRASRGDNEMNGLEAKVVSESPPLGGSEVSFQWFQNRRLEEERKLKKLLSVLKEACPLWDYVYHKMRGAEILWAFLVSKCSVFQFPTVDMLIRHLGEHVVKNRHGIPHKVKWLDGKRFLKFRRAMRMREGKDPTEYTEEIQKLTKDLRMKHPDYTEAHIKNLAWYKLWFDNLLRSYHRKALITCYHCPQLDK